MLANARSQNSIDVADGATFNAILDGWQPEARPQEAEPPGPSEAPLEGPAEESGWIACVRTGGHGSEVRPTPPAQNPHALLWAAGPRRDCSLSWVYVP